MTTTIPATDLRTGDMIADAAGVLWVDGPVTPGEHRVDEPPFVWTRAAVIVRASAVPSGWVAPRDGENGPRWTVQGNKHRMVGVIARDVHDAADAERVAAEHTR